MGEDSIYKILEERIDHLKEVHERYVAESDDRLKLQAKEYKRRLDALNGEAERLRSMQASYVPREVYAQFEMSTNKEITALREWKATQTGKTYVFGIVIVLLVTAIMWGFDYFK